LVEEKKVGIKSKIDTEKTGAVTNELHEGEKGVRNCGVTTFASREGGGASTSSCLSKRTNKCPRKDRKRV